MRYPGAARRCTLRVSLKSRRRFYRTTLLGVLAMAALIWVAVQQFGIAPGELANLLLATLILVVLVIAAAGVVALCWIGLRKLRRGKPD